MVAAGNQGDKPIYLNKNFNTLDTSLFTFLKFSNSINIANGSTIVDIWGGVSTSFYVGVHIYNTQTNSFEASTPFLYNGAISGNYSHILYDSDVWNPDPCSVSISTGIDPFNNKPRVQLSIDNSAQDDNYRFALIEIRAYNGQTKMWVNEGASFDSNSYAAPVFSGSTNSTVGEIGGTGKNIISVVLGDSRKLFLSTT